MMWTTTGGRTRAPALLRAIPALFLAFAGASAADGGVARVFEEFTAGVQPGCSVAVSKDGAVVHSAGYGYADVERKIPLTPQSVFNVASISKEFTAFSILLLEQRGKLSLDDSIRKHVPELGVYADRITLRQLLRHTGGLGDFGELLALGGDDSVDYTEAGVLAVLARRQGPDNPPDQGYAYSNTGYFLLSLVVKRVTGTSLREFAEEEIFEPLVMNSTTIGDHWPLRIANVARGYAVKDGRYVIEESASTAVGSSRVFTTVLDLAKWDANLRTGRVGGAALARRMIEPGRVNGQPMNYAAGLRLSTHRGLATYGHPGADYGYRSDYRSFPQRRLGVIVLCNRSDAGAWDRSVAVADVFLRDVPVGLPGDARQLADLPGRAEPDQLPAGLYRSEIDASYVKLVHDSRGVVFEEPAASHILKPRGQGIYTTTFDIPGWYRFDMDYAFFPAAAGHAARIRGQFYGEPADYVHVSPWRPGNLSAYVGTYESQELQRRYELRLEQGRLMLDDGRDTSELRPMAPQEFQARDTLRVLRFPIGETAGEFSLYAGGARGLRFSRVTP